MTHLTLSGRRASVSGLPIRRLLPDRERRTLGAWCFVDHFGPTTLPPDAHGVGPHPHIGLQTVTWLFDGQMHHGDSVGSVQALRPGQLNLMTSGHGITHWEHHRTEVSRDLHGLQLWVALPDADRSVDPFFEHHGALPTHTEDGWQITVFHGQLGPSTSPATAFSPLVGAELCGDRSGTVTLDPSFEHGLLAIDGDLSVDGHPLEQGQMRILDPGHRQMELSARGPVRAILLGGVPFGEKLLMWWNFVGRTHDDIAQAREQWQARAPRFGSATDWPDGILDAPPLPRQKLVPR